MKPEDCRVGARIIGTLRREGYTAEILRVGDHHESFQGQFLTIPDGRIEMNQRFIGHISFWNLDPIYQTRACPQCTKNNHIGIISCCNCGFINPTGASNVIPDWT